MRCNRATHGMSCAPSAFAAATGSREPSPSVRPEPSMPPGANAPERTTAELPTDAPLSPKAVVFEPRLVLRSGTPCQPFLCDSRTGK